MTEAPATAARTRESDPAGGWRDVLLLWLASRVVLEGIALLAVAVAGPARDPEPGFFGLLHHWDSDWFTAIAQAGYTNPSTVPGADPAPRAAFFPGYPLTARGLAWLAGGGQVTDGSTRFALWLVPFVASFVAAWFLYRTVAPRFGTAVARWSTGLLLLGPYAVFLAASYSEALFLAAAIAAWWALVRQRPWLAGLLAAAASWTRVNGVFLAVALVVLHLQQQREAGRPVRVRDLAGLAVSFAGAAGYLGWLWATTGEPTSWLQAQSDRFGRQGTWPWVSLYHALKLPFVETRTDYRIQNVEELLAAAVLVVAVVAFVRTREWAAAVFVVLSMVSLVTNVSFLSLARNVLTIFPVFVLGAVVVVRSPRRRLVTAGVAVTAVLTVVNTVSFALGFWTD